VLEGINRNGEGGMRVEGRKKGKKGKKKSRDGSKGETQPERRNELERKLRHTVYKVYSLNKGNSEISLTASDIHSNEGGIIRSVYNKQFFAATFCLDIFVILFANVSIYESHCMVAIIYSPHLKCPQNIEYGVIQRTDVKFNSSQCEYHLQLAECSNYTIFHAFCFPVSGVPICTNVFVVRS
jgi:hypothetical protein